MSCTKWPVKRGTSWVSSACSAPVPAHQLQLHAGPLAQDHAERPAARRLLGGLVEQSGGVEDHRRRAPGRSRAGRRRRPRRRGRRAAAPAARRASRWSAGWWDRSGGSTRRRRRRTRAAPGSDGSATKTSTMPPAHAPLPDLDDRLRALVAGCLEGLQQQLALEAVAGADAQRAGRELGRRGQRRVETGRRRHHHHRLAGAQPPGDDRALGVGLAVVAASPETRLPLGELQHGGAEELQILRPPVGIDHRADDDDGRTRMGVQELGDGQRAGGAGEAGDAQASVSLGEGLRQALERLPILQHRSGFTVSRGVPRRAGGA